MRAEANQSDRNRREPVSDGTPGGEQTAEETNECKDAQNFGSLGFGEVWVGAEIDGRAQSGAVLCCAVIER